MLFLYIRKSQDPNADLLYILGFLFVNFISFYKRYLVNNKIKNSTFYITDNRNIIKDLKNNHISPENSEGMERKYVLSQLAEWENDLE